MQLANLFFCLLPFAYCRLIKTSNITHPVPGMSFETQLSTSFPLTVNRRVDTREWEEAIAKELIDNTLPVKVPGKKQKSYISINKPKTEPFHIDV